ncbi:tRNA (guanosine(46)-N7)-methyltransferase TrmB [Alkalilimnicola sp. S0819]|uniref:tRNA (guanosine(46)-N7)-methyltransferase TrmB n=1 Tax=Alkalilimnicola sp. S0819 TaxID=2613922 RepID=UPI0012619A9B|nr:tRNA (guanosine(46)-N7)-methyltransferase TrmB [Alkalilimnicola sp. S0819]KAB7623386.1 tRNA (guanosine(46)-N7)-methyltransferase TrmB [Alkalilimnicola sp. S0819]MPQ16929.1 tRNA (guanosine(46)-N7)-methyltransferase TrmB [Alkalilimnicola sp. S0819]
MSEQAAPVPRRIRSFVRREGRLTEGQERALKELWPVYGLEPGTEALDFPALFGREAPVVLEIGFGNGDSLAEQARLYPERNYLGIEVHRPGVGHLLMHIERLQLENLRLMSCDAAEVLRRQIADESLSGLQLYFPDPWPKKRHHKRRLVQPEWTQLLRRKLAPDGFVHLATDWAPYAEHMMAVFSAAEGFANTAGDGQFSDRGDRPRTKFEQRGLRKGHGVWDLMFRRCA